MDDDIRSLLGLGGYCVLEVSGYDGDAVVRVEPPAEDGCPRCGVITTRVHTRSPRPSGSCGRSWAVAACGSWSTGAGCGAPTAVGPSRPGCPGWPRAPG